MPKAARLRRFVTRRRQKANQSTTSKTILALTVFLLYNLVYGFRSSRQVKTAEVRARQLKIKMQPNSHGHECLADTTIVTAYYKLGELSKYSDRVYRRWNRNFFKLKDAMVIFTNLQTLPALKSLRRSTASCTLFVVQDLANTYTASLASWYKQHNLDPEKRIHSAELYIIWNEKSEWLGMVAEKNPFNSTHFFWADAGQFRSEVSMRSCVHSGVWIRHTSFIPPKKVLLLSIQSFKPHELFLDDSGKSLLFDSRIIRLGGGNFGGDRESSLLWRTRFYKKLQEYLAAGVFAGKDQPIMASVCVEFPSQCYMVEGKKVVETDDVWFALQPILSGATRHIPTYIPQSLTSFTRPRSKW